MYERLSCFQLIPVWFPGFWFGGCKEKFVCWSHWIQCNVWWRAYHGVGLTLGPVHDPLAPVKRTLTKGFMISVPYLSMKSSIHQSIISWVRNACSSDLNHAKHLDWRWTVAGWWRKVLPTMSIKLWCSTQMRTPKQYVGLDAVVEVNSIKYEKELY